MKTLAALLLSLPVQGAIWQAHLPNGDIGTAVQTSWGAVVSYSAPGAERVAIDARSAWTQTTRSADAPLNLSWSAGENIDWASLATEHAVSFWAYYPNSLTLSAEFYNESDPGPPRAMAMYSAAGDSHIAVPEITAWSWLALPLVVFACIRKSRKLA